MATPDPPPHPWATVGCGRRGDYEWFDRHEPIEQGQGRNLPHWQQPGAICFVTFRTADSIPAAVLKEWVAERDRWLAAHPEPHGAETRKLYHRLFTERMHRFLDDCHGECPFKSAEVRQIIVEVMQYNDRDEGTYVLDEYVIMPNHVHVLVSPRNGADVSKIDEIWKRVSAHRINKLLGRRGTLWQHESWDHAVRSPEHLDHYCRYIRDNPKRLPRV